MSIGLMKILACIGQEESGPMQVTIRVGQLNDFSKKALSARSSNAKSKGRYYSMLSSARIIAR